MLGGLIGTALQVAVTGLDAGLAINVGTRVVVGLAGTVATALPGIIANRTEIKARVKASASSAADSVRGVGSKIKAKWAAKKAKNAANAAKKQANKTAKQGAKASKKGK